MGALEVHAPSVCGNIEVLSSMGETQGEVLVLAALPPLQRRVLEARAHAEMLLAVRAAGTVAAVARAPGVMRVAVIGRSVAAVVCVATCV